MWIKEIFVSDGKVGEQMDHHSRNMKSDDTFFFVMFRMREAFCFGKVENAVKVQDTMKRLADYYYYTRLFFYFFF